MKNSSIFLMLICLLYSCKKEKLEGETLIFEGKWKWTNSQITYNTGTPNSSYEIVTSDSFGFPDDYYLEFDRKGRVKFYKNDVIEKKYRIVFFIFEETSPSVDGYHFIIYLNNDSDNMLSGSISQDSLWVDDSNIPLVDQESSGSTIFYNHLYLKVD